MMKSICSAPLFLLASVLYGKQNPQDSLLNLLPVQTGEQRVGTLNELSWYYKSINTDSAVLFASEALRLASQLRQPPLIAASYNSLGTIHQMKGDYDSALTYLKGTLDIYESLSDTVNLPNTLNNIGICYDELADYDKALQYYFQGLQIAEKRNDLENSAMLISNMGIVYKKQKDFDNASRYYERALDLYKQLNSDFGIAVTTGNLGSIYLQLREFRKCIDFSMRARKLYDQLGFKRYIPYVIGNAAIAYDSLGSAPIAQKLYFEAVALHKAQENRYETAFQYKNLASFYHRNKQPRQARLYADSAVELASTIGAREFLQDALLVRSQILAASHDFQAAYQTFLEYNMVKDSLFSSDKTRQIYQLQTQYETEKKEQQIALQQAELAEKEAQNQRNLAIISGLAFMILLLGIIIFLARSRERKKREMLQQLAAVQLRETQLDAAITSQEKERTRFAQDLHDGFGQMISILNLNLKSLQKAGKNAHEIFDQSAKVLEDMYQELKNICFNLMPQTLIRQGLPSALAEFAARINATGKLFVETDFFNTEDRLAELQEVSLYRVTQEWVNNILKYSDATKITLQLTRDEEELTLLIEDNGMGFDPKLLTDGKGNGWKNIQSRINLIRGEIQLDTTPGLRGSTLIVNMPVQVTPQRKDSENTVLTV